MSRFKMSGGRILCIGSRWMSSSCQKARGVMNSSLARAPLLYFPKNLFGLVPSKSLPPIDIPLINKRFFRNGKRSSGDTSSLSFKLSSRLGLALGICSGTLAYYSYSIAWAAKGQKCEEECVKKKKCDVSCLHKMDYLEELIIRSNAELELALADTKMKLIDFTQAAMKTGCEAIPLMDEYLKYGYLLIDNEKLEDPIYEDMWCRVYSIAKKRCEKVKEALDNIKIAWELLRRLHEIIRKGRECKFTCHNPILNSYEQAAKCAEVELKNLRVQMEKVHSKHAMVVKHKPDIDNFRKELKTTIHVQLCTEEYCKVVYAEEERALMIHEAYRKAVKVQKKLAKAYLWPCANTTEKDCEDTEEQEAEEDECEEE